MELISREAVERLLIKWFTQCTEEEFFDLKKAVDELPEIKIDEGYIEELERKANESRPKGKWIEYPDCLKYDGALLGEDFVCSNCEAVWSAIDNEGERFKFCPNCGADMRGKE